jgi:putative ABC transport system ATP-binding protein
VAQLGILQRGITQDPRQSRFAVEMKHVRKAYGPSEENLVFSDLHFQLMQGTFVAAVGPIGSGKTTLVNMFAGIEKPTSGAIFVEGQEITALDGDALASFRSKTIGLVPQIQSLIPELTIRENVELPLHFSEVSREKRADRVEAVLDRVGISNDSERVVNTLSVGERQLVSVARALVNDPPILLLDEPTEALDPLMSEVILGLLRGDNLIAGKTIFVTTHDKRVVDLAKRTLRVRKKIP